MRLLAALLLALAAVATPASAAPFQLSGPDAVGKRYELQRQRGRVVMVFYWSTACAVCRDKLPELRANLAGWAGKPFDLVLVNLDTREADWRSYEQLLETTQAGRSSKPISLWGLSPDFRHSLAAKPAKLPLTLVLDVKGEVAHRYEGRIAPEAWDAVAELLP